MSYKSTRQEVDRINAILYAFDPIGIGIPEDEYIGEAEVIADGMHAMRSEHEVFLLVYHTFASAFSSPGDRDEYREIAHQIWSYVVKSKHRGTYD